MAWGIDRVKARLTVFNPQAPEIWCSVTERLFASAGIKSDDAKFDYTIGALDNQAQMEVGDILLNPPPTGAYLKLKAELIKRFSGTQQQKTRRLLDHEELGDRKPSQFLRRLRDLGGAALTEELLRTLWTGRLPRDVQIGLVGRMDDSLDRVAEIADHLAEMSVPRSTIFETSRPRSTAAETKDHHAEPGVRELSLVVSALREEIQALHQKYSPGSSTAKKHPPARSSRSAGRPEQARSRIVSRPADYLGICWYHLRFGAAALKCEAPCKFRSENSTGPH